MTSLAERPLNPPRGGGVEPLAGEALQQMKQALGGGWQVTEAQHLKKTFRFDDFQSALDFTNRVGELAESADHHPEICLGWGKATVELWTHSIDGLSEADFVFCARVEQFA